MKYVPLWAALVLVISGCAGQKELVEEQRLALQELAEENSRLASEIEVLRDSLQFVDDVETGQYYRDRRQLEQQINRLEYEIAVLRDSAHAPVTDLLTMTADALFEPASATISEAGARRLDEAADSLSVARGRTIRVEGHSDSVPVGPGLRDRYPSNWELSAARAAAVVRYLIDQHGFEADRFEVAAFADTRPAASNQTASGRSQNRRVDIGYY